MKRIVLALFILLFGTLVSVSQLSETSNASKERVEAERLWEQMVKIKGGREKLHSVSNWMLIKGDKADNIEIQFYVYPNKYWEWNKETKFHDFLFITMANLDADVFMVASHEGIVTNQKLATASERANYRETYLMDACAFFLETRWLKPTPIRVSQQKVGKERFDVVETRFTDLSEYKDWRTDYYVDQESLVVKGVASYSADGNMYKYYSFDGYTTVNGIEVPLKFDSAFGVIDPKKATFTHLNFQFNVDYDEKLFERPPSIEAGPDAWKPKAKQN